MTIQKTTPDPFPPLENLGWTSYFQNQLQPSSQKGLLPARIAGVSKGYFRTTNGRDHQLATLSGKLVRDAQGRYPITGDWVLMKDKVIFEILKRRNSLSRGASGSRHHQDPRPAKAQAIAANLDTVFIVSGLDRDFNLSRIERYLTLVYSCGLTPAVILTKADLHQAPESFARRAESVAFGVPVHLVSASDETCLKALVPYLAPGKTAAMLGSSGAGKSTLINRLCGRAVQATAEVSTQVGKGRHTTTSRDLILMPQGGMIIDNPGIREIAFWETGEGTQTAFPDIEALAGECRFSDCSHDHEPGCRVTAAVALGKLAGQRLENYRKMKRELDYLSQRRNKSADRVEKERWKEVALKIKAINKQG